MRKKQRVLLVALVVLSIGTQMLRAQNASLRRGILKYTNQYRAANGLGPLELADVPATLAQKHSEDMARHRTGFGHGGFQQRTDRLRRAYGNAIATGENVAYGKLSAREVVDIWIHSRPHRKNLLGNFNKIGIGIASDKQGILYFTQLFVRTR